MSKTPWNPSKKATARVNAPLPAPTVCPNCGDDVAIVHHNDVYGRAYGVWPWLYRGVDNDCDSYVGMHPFTNIPVGTLADPSTREARKACKPAFEALWKGEAAFLSRKQAYQALASQLGIPVKECHFAWFSAATCLQAREACERLMQNHQATETTER